jgi:glycosyltransferase involved in cell wall biosynthesis
MRILRVAQDIYPDTVGGAPYHIHALSRDQAEMGHDVTVLTVSDGTDKPRREERDGYMLVRQRPGVDLFGNELFTGTLDFLRDADQYDVIHAHSHLFFSSNVAAAFGRFTDTALAVTCHGLISQRAPELVSRAHLHTVGKWTYDAADVTFTYTDVERERLRELGVDADVRVVSNGVEIDRFAPNGDHHDVIDQAAGAAILFVGRLVEGKRPDDVLAAFKRVHRELPSAQLFYCGDGPMMDDLQRSVAASGLDDAVTFLGQVPYDEMPTVFRAADLFVLASRTEGFPRTVMESLACGTPVVSTHLEQTAPVVEKAGETVSIGDVEGLASAIDGLVSEPARLGKLGSTGRAMIKAEYDWEGTVQQTTAATRALVETVRESPQAQHRPIEEREVTPISNSGGG